MKYSGMELVVDDGVAVITFNRPERMNAKIIKERDVRYNPVL